MANRPAPPPKPRGPSLSAIAAAAGVTKSTVSKALGPQSADYPLNAETKARIVAIARDLGWQPAVGNRLRQRRLHHTVALLSGSDYLPTRGIYQDLLRDLALALAYEGFDLGVISLGRKLRQRLRPLPHNAVDGYLILGESTPLVQALLAQRPLPHGILNWPCDLPADQFLADEASGVIAAVQHLRALGHHRLLFFRAQIWPFTSPTVRTTGILSQHDSTLVDETHPALRERQAACHTAGMALGMTVETLLGTGAELVERCRAELGPSAILTYSEGDALVACTSLQDAGIAIPHAVSLISGSQGNTLPWLRPPVTTVEIPVTRMVNQAVEVLVQHIHGYRPPLPVAYRLPGRLELRASTAPPPN
jgi:DNA-binding LacI/PurR family transcriptional regulator